MTTRILAVIPAKSRSRRLPGKNMRLLGGKPLLQHALDALARCRRVTDTCVATDSPEIRDYCQERGVLVPYLLRAEACGDEVSPAVPVVDILEHLGGETRYTHCVMLLPSSPLTSARSIDEVVRLSVESGAGVVSVTPLGGSFAHVRAMSPRGRLAPVAADAGRGELFYLNGSIHCAPTGSLMRSRSFYHGEPLAHVMPHEESLDIDTEADLRLAEAYLATLRTDVA